MPKMVRSYRERWQQNRAGLTGSLLLHGLAVALWLAWALGHPVRAAPPLKGLLVDLVRLPVIAPGVSGGAPQAVRPREASAPRVFGIRPQAVTPPPDALEA